MFRRKFEQLLRWARDVEWIIVSSTVATVLISVPEILEEIDQEMMLLEYDAGWPAIVMLVFTVLMRSNVWSRATVIEIAADDHLDAVTAQGDIRTTPVKRSPQYVGVKRGEKPAIPGV